MQVAADVLGAPVYAADVLDAAALGAAFRAAHGARARARARLALVAARCWRFVLDVVARPLHACTTRPTSARYLRLEDDVASGKWK